MWEYSSLSQLKSVGLDCSNCIGWHCKTPFTLQKNEYSWLLYVHLVYSFKYLQFRMLCIGDRECFLEID